MDALQKAGNLATTIFHHVGTCEMGMDGGGVLAPDLKAYDIGGLLVVDASIMSRITSGNTASPVITIDEKAADIIRNGTSSRGLAAGLSSRIDRTESEGTMKAVGYRAAGPISNKDALEDVELPVVAPTGRDIRVAVRAVSVNPVDTKIRRGVAPTTGEYRVLGWDAAGVVEAVGPEASLFKPGDEVFYAGSLDRPGSNSELHLVDERIVGRKPRSLGFAEAAALPLTAITAWEAIFDRLDVTRPTREGSGMILVIGGAGGVGSIAIQILRQLTSLTIIATASRTETQAWVKEMGAHHVADHRMPLHDEIKRLGLGAPGFVFSTTETDKHFDSIAELMAPQGRFCLIDDPPPLDIMKLKRKSLSLHWELMFTRPLYGTSDIDEQHRLLNTVSAMVDEGRIRSTMTAHYGRINAANLMSAHALIESGSARGKVVLEGF